MDSGDVAETSRALRAAIRANGRSRSSLPSWERFATKSDRTPRLQTLGNRTFCLGTPPSRARTRRSSIELGGGETALAASHRRVLRDVGRVTERATVVGCGHQRSRIDDYGKALRTFPGRSSRSSVMWSSSATVNEVARRVTRSTLLWAPFVAAQLRRSAWQTRTSQRASPPAPSGRASIHPRHHHRPRHSRMRMPMAR
jgi:hypothetical protein